MPVHSNNQTGNTDEYVAPSPAHYNYQRNYRNVKEHMENDENDHKGDKVNIKGLD